MEHYHSTPEASFHAPLETEPQAASSEALDDKWYGRFCELSSSILDNFEVTEAERDEQKEAFLAGDTRNPHFYYFKVDGEKLREQEQGLLILKADIKDQEANETVRQAYVWTINEAIASNRMSQQIAVLNQYTEALNNPWASSEERESLEKLKDKAMRRFKRYSEFIYGKPSPDIFAYSAERYTRVADSLADHEDLSVRLAAHRVREVFGDIHQDTDHTLAPISEEAFQTVREHTEQVQGDIINFTEFEGKVDRETMIELFQRALDQTGATDFGFTLQTENANQKIFSVSQDRKEVNVPPRLSPVYKRMKELIIHEIGTHVVRRMNGERSRLKLLGMGLDRYDTGEEGTAVAREQSTHEYSEDIDFDKLERHTAIALALGLDGTPRDFRDVFAIMRDIYFLNKVASGSKLDSANDIANNNAWLNTMRTFRGTDHKTPGVAFTKDIVYSEGNAATWRLVGENPAIVNLFLVGKIDIANPRHIEILIRLGITDEDLQVLSTP